MHMPVETVQKSPSVWKKAARPFVVLHFKGVHVGLLCSNVVMRVHRYAIDGDKQRFRIPDGGLIIANHTGFRDPMIVANVFRSRQLHFLAAENVMSNRAMNALMRSVGCIRVDRRICDLESMKKVITVLKSGEPLAIFPEGGIHAGDSVGTFKSGMIVMAVRANVPIYPVYIAPGRSLWNRRQQAMVGKCFRIGDYCDRPVPTMADIDRMAAALHEYELTLKAALEEKTGQSQLLPR
jgi:1-acyl-sn-glycerol-3-phosphate acyltransferase